MKIIPPTPVHPTPQHQTQLREQRYRCRWAQANMGFHTEKEIHAIKNNLEDSQSQTGSRCQKSLHSKLNSSKLQESVFAQWGREFQMRPPRIAKDLFICGDGNASTRGFSKLKLLLYIPGLSKQNNFLHEDFKLFLRDQSNIERRS